MTSQEKQSGLPALTAFTVLHHEQGYVGYCTPSGDVGAALSATGKTVIVECARVDSEATPPRFAVERAVLEQHRHSPVPVYVGVEWASPRREHEEGFLPLGLCPLDRFDHLATSGAADAETVGVVPWELFWRAQSRLSLMDAPPAHVASAVELSAEDLRDPQLAQRLSSDQPCCDAEEPMPRRHLVRSADSDTATLPWVWQVPHPPRELFHYTWADGSYQRTEAAPMRERLREHLQRVEAVRSQPGGLSLVVTRPWRTLRPITAPQLAIILRGTGDEPRPPWAAHVMRPDDDSNE